MRDIDTSRMSRVSQANSRRKCSQASKGSAHPVNDGIGSAKKRKIKFKKGGFIRVMEIMYLGTDEEKA